MIWSILKRARGKHYLRIFSVIILLQMFILLSRYNKSSSISEPIIEKVKTAPPSLNASVGLWQNVGGKSQFRFLVYSAFLDVRSSKRVAIIAVTRTASRKKPALEVWCKFWYYSNDGVYVKLLPGNLKIIKEHWNLYYSAYYLFCPLELDESVPDVVSVLTSPNQEPENMLKIIRNYVGDAQWDPFELSLMVDNMAVCVKPLHYDYNKVMEILEFIELYRIMGVNHFFLYNHTVGPQVDCILRHYEREGLVTILPWQLPIVSQKEIRTEGIFASLNDCLYRTMHRYSHTIFVDFDEFIIPRNSYNYSQLFQSLSKEHDLKRISSFSFRNAFFYRQWPDDERAKTANVTEKLIVLRKTRRKTELHKHRTRSKMIVRPELIQMVGNHFIWEYYDKSKFDNMNVKESDAFMHHYRVCEFGGDDCVTSTSTVDTTAYRYKNPLIDAVTSRYEKYFVKCNLADVVE
ncbi:uncharacterized protein LOC126741505 [Anthonomus grandis grandis]|uniref:uncharacterized protein LOC126741505 n=1 Tax=Anthonomus grandis grandis TaxID=2921223 RepID=UPI0021654C43|nr:uncharacterized protein LOC126741505 [Anthonomus grandis grandis]XP_050303884.1 uncharacterized protein LOC126741505 [Anthonomus grandis grandis]